MIGGPVTSIEGYGMRFLAPDRRWRGASSGDESCRGWRPMNRASGGWGRRHLDQFQLVSFDLYGHGSLDAGDGDDQFFSPLCSRIPSIPSRHPPRILTRRPTLRKECREQVT